MLPKEYRKHYTVVTALSLLVHTFLVALIMWNPLFEVEKSKDFTTIKIDLKKTEKTEEAKKPKSEKKEEWEKVKKERKEKKEKETKEKKKAEKKDKTKSEERKDSAKKETVKKEIQKQKAEKKKESDPLSETYSVEKTREKKPGEKVSESVSTADKVSNAPSEKPANAKPTKAKEPPRKSENNKKPAQDKIKPKPAKREIDKATEKPKSAKPVPKPSKDKKESKLAKQAEQLLQRADAVKPNKPGQIAAPAPTENKNKPKGLDPTSPEYWMQKLGSMRQLNERDLKRTIVAAEGFGRQFQDRSVKGKKAVKNLNRIELQMRNQYLLRGIKMIEKYLNAPHFDGNIYHGEISLLLDREGYIEKIAFKKRSGHEELDNAFYQAVLSTGRLELPPDPKVAYAFYTNPITLSYTEEDMAD